MIVDTYTPTQLNEYVACSNNCIGFVKRHCKLLSIDEGYIPFELYPFQQNLLECLLGHQKPIFNLSRQLGYTSCVFSYTIWKSIFQEDFSTLFVFHTQKKADLFCEKFKGMYFQIPDYLQQGVVEETKRKIKFQNGSVIEFSGSFTNSDHTNVFVDDAAFFPNGKLRSFVEKQSFHVLNVKKVIISSIPNKKKDYFHKLWLESLGLGSNMMRPVMIDWEAIPSRDQLWKKRMEQTIGQESFAQEYCNEFVV